MPRLRSSVVEVRVVEGALAGLVDDELAGGGIKRCNDVVPGLAANEDPAHRSGIADAQTWRAALDLGRRCVRQIGQVAFARVDDEHAGVARSCEHRTTGRDGALQERDVVAERLAEAAGLQKVALHVDDEQRRARPGELDCGGLGVNKACDWRHRLGPSADPGADRTPLHSAMNEARPMPLYAIRKPYPVAVNSPEYSGG